MPAFFPHSTGAFRLEEPAGLRRLSMSAIGMAAVTGVVVRLLRALVFMIGPVESIAFLALSLGVGLLIVFSAVTLHLGNFTVRHWLWRAPAFAAAEAAAEALTALLLIAPGLEPNGSSRALFSDWPGMALGVLVWRFVAIVTFAALLAGVVQVVRYVLVKREHRGHTLDAIHHEGAPRGPAPGE